jgi:cysteine-rich repeat protein
MLDLPPQRLQNGGAGTGAEASLQGLGAAAAVSLLLAVAALPARALPAAAPARLQERLQRVLQAPGAAEWVRIGVSLRSDDLPAPLAATARRARVAERQERVMAALAPGSFRPTRRYRMLSGFAGWAQRAAVEGLSRHPEVDFVYLDGVALPSLAQGAAQVGADAAHALGVTGDGINVAILDSGIDADHPDLEDGLVAERCFCSDSHPSPMVGAPCCPNGQESQSGPGAAADVSGHGTAVAGIISSDGGVAPLGVAPDAGIVAVKVSGPDGALFSDIAAGLEWVFENRNAFSDPVRVVNISLADPNEYNDPNDPDCASTNTSNAIEALEAVGIAVFASSGNSGFDDGIAFPACNASAISVGGVYDASFASVQWCAPTGCPAILCTDTNPSPDTFVCHSNSDEILDLLAPNYRTRTTWVGGGIQNDFAGTSASSAYAAAQAALLLEADPGLTPAQVLASLSSSGTTVQNPANGLSFPRPDVGELVTAIVAVCGNGSVEPGEDCDDGGTVDGDCCAADCSYEAPDSGCDDADACTGPDTCDGAGVCVGGPPPLCDDANACTDDSCDSVSGCLFQPNADPCDDGDACTTQDTCSAGSCSGGPPPDCDDGDPCTAESCDALEGCVHTPIFPGCSVIEIPALPGPGLVLLGGLLTASGILLAERRLR